MKNLIITVAGATNTGKSTVIAFIVQKLGALPNVKVKYLDKQSKEQLDAKVDKFYSILKDTEIEIQEVQLRRGLNPHACFGREPHRMDFDDLDEYLERKGLWTRWELENQGKPLLKTGISQIAEEREKQLQLGRNEAGDSLVNGSYELAKVARALIRTHESGVFLQTDFPDNWATDWCKKTIDKSYEERLRIAGALIVAELDRLNYEKQK